MSVTTYVIMFIGYTYVQFIYPSNNECLDLFQIKIKVEVDIFIYYFSLGFSFKIYFYKYNFRVKIFGVKIYLNTFFLDFSMYFAKMLSQMTMYLVRRCGSKDRENWENMRS